MDLDHFTRNKAGLVFCKKNRRFYEDFLGIFLSFHSGSPILLTGKGLKKVVSEKYRYWEKRYRNMTFPPLNFICHLKVRIL